MKQILVFVLLSGMLCWFMFSPIYKHILVVRHAVLQKEVDLMLEIGASGSYGYIDEVMVNNSKQRLEDRGFQPEDLVYSITSSNGEDGTNPNNPLHRGVGLSLRISYPYHNLFEMDRLVGIAPPAEGSRMAAAGMKMSEYVPD